MKDLLVAAHLRGLRPTPTSKKDTTMIKENSNTKTINQTLNYLLLQFFKLLCVYTDTYLIRIHNKRTKI